MVFVVLAPGSEVCRERNRDRDPQQRWELTGYDAMEVSLRNEIGDPVGGWTVSDLTAEATASKIVNDAAVRAPLR